ncbi:MAG: phosphoribosylglycinamide formyltransferase [Myxococcota bacterium]
MTQRVAVLVSGTGSNLQALIDAHIEDAQIVRVISNVMTAAALRRAADAGIPVSFIDHRGRKRVDFDRETRDQLLEDEVDWVVLAGFMRILGPDVLDAFPDRIINIHPSLLPAFPGLNAPAQAFRAGVAIAGCTVHLVDAGADTGPILAQTAVPVHPDDDEEALRQRILAAEHLLLPRVLRALVQGKLRKGTKRTYLDAPTSKDVLSNPNIGEPHG